MTRTCGVCADLSADCVDEPIGRNDRLVPVCGSCRNETPVVRHEVARSWKVDESSPITQDEARALPKPPPMPRYYGGVGKAGRKAAFNAVATGSTDPLRQLGPGKVHKIRRIRDNGALTIEEACEIAKQFEWYARSKYVGNDARYYIFHEADKEIAK